jgi:Type II CAAX prenyl endopeptidase Rce1-like
MLTERVSAPTQRSRSGLAGLVTVVVAVAGPALAVIRFGFAGELVALAIAGAWAWQIRHTATPTWGSVRTSARTWVSLAALGAGCGAAVVVMIKVGAVNPSSIDFARARPSWLVVVPAVAGLALVNSVVEEFLWRRAVIDILDERAKAGPVWCGALQACSFGAAHWAGLPGGRVGIVAAAIFGVVMYTVRRSGATMVRCVVVHFFTDAVIFAYAAAAIVSYQQPGFMFRPD